MPHPTTTPTTAAETTRRAAAQPPAGGRGRVLEVQARPIAAVFAWAVALGVGLYFFNATALVLLGFLAAAALAAVMKPVRDKLPGPRWFTGVAAGLIPVLVFLGLIALLSWIVVGPLSDQLGQLSQVQGKVNDLIARVAGAFGIQDAPTVSDILGRLRAILVRDGSAVVAKTATIVSVFLVALAFLFFGCLYLLTERERRILPPILKLLPRHRRPQVEAAVHDLEPRLRWWLLGTFLSILIIGAASWIGFWAVGLAMAVPLALLAGFSEIVPTIGPAFAFLVALVVALTQGTSVAIGVACVYLVIQLLESYVLLPLVMREAVRMPPVVTLFTVVFWGQVLGMAGLLLAIPLNLTIWSFADRLLRDEEDEADSADGALPPAAQADLLARERGATAARVQPRTP